MLRGLSMFQLLVFFASILLPCRVEASHFRGGIITWRPLSQPDATQNNSLPMIEISYRMSWRRSSSGHSCTDESVASRTLLRGEGSLSCSCSGLSQALSYICTDFSEEENWTTGINSAQYQPDVPVFEIWFTGSAWITLNNGGSGWDLGTTVNLTIREDTGRINSSPTTATLPIVRFQGGCNNIIRIPVADADGDDVRCFWATRRCGGICNRLPGAVMNEETCELTWNVGNSTSPGLYGVAIEIQDFPTKTSSEALSTIPLQFLVELSAAGQRSDCVSQPVFIPPTRVSASCIGVPQNTTYQGTIVVRTGSPDVSLSALETVSPQGVSYSEVRPYPGGLETDYYIEATWTPETVGIVDILCFIARDSVGTASEQTCISLVTGTTPPQPIASSLKPMNGSRVPQKDLPLQLQFDQEIVRSMRPALFTIFDENDTLIYQRDAQSAQEVDFLEGNRVAFTIPESVLNSSVSYYILMDSGVARSTAFCGVESPSVTERSFWSFSVVGTDNPPVISGCPNATITSQAPASQNYSTVTWSEPTATDDLGTPKRGRNHAPPSVFPIGTTTVIYRFTDSASQVSTCQFLVKVTDVSPPEISNCPTQPVVRVLTSGQTSVAVVYDAPTATDNSQQAISVVSSHNPGDKFFTGTTTVTYNFTDTSGNTGTCVFDTVVNPEVPEGQSFGVVYGVSGALLFLVIVLSIAVVSYLYFKNKGGFNPGTVLTDSNHPLQDTNGVQKTAAV